MHEGEEKNDKDVKEGEEKKGQEEPKEEEKKIGREGERSDKGRQWGKNEEDELTTKEDKGEEKEENKHVGPKLLRLLGLSRKGREQKKKRSMSLLMQR